MGSTRLTSRRRQDQGAKWARVVIAVLATVGVIDTGSITLNRWGFFGALTCPGGADGCTQVLNSAWGTIFKSEAVNIPLSFVGFLIYAAMLLMAIGPMLPGLADSKTELSRKTWWGMFAFSCAMASFSLVLIGLMVFKIQAFCFFCVLSACLSVAMLILSIIGGGWEDLAQLLFRGVLLFIAVLLGGLIWASVVDPNRPDAVVTGPGIPPAVITKSDSTQVSLAEHLTASGSVMYSAYWCPHCHEQKEMFGKEAAAKLKIIECSADGQNSQQSLCERKGIEGYPTWEINGKLDSGVKDLKELANLSGYKGSRDF